MAAPVAEVPIERVMAPYPGVDWSKYVVVQSNDTPPVSFKVLRDAAKMSTYLTNLIPLERTKMPPSRFPSPKWMRKACTTSFST